MKPAIVYIIAIGVLGAGAAVFFNARRDACHTEAANSPVMLLSVQAEAGGPAAKLSIRCSPEATEVRLYIPIRQTPPVGGAGGTEVIDVSESFQDRNPRPSASSAPAPTSWNVADDGSYAWRPDARTFIDQMFVHDWLRMQGVSFGGGRLGASDLVFPLTGLAQHRDAITRSCGVGSRHSRLSDLNDLVQG